MGRLPLLFEAMLRYPSLTPIAYHPRMFGVRLRSLFTSRWMAILWAILVCLTAIQFVGVGDDGAGQGNDSVAASADALTAQQRDAINSVF